jgi:hypothetical protein
MTRRTFAGGWSGTGSSGPGWAFMGFAGHEVIMLDPRAARWAVYTPAGELIRELVPEEVPAELCPAANGVNWWLFLGPAGDLYLAVLDTGHGSH